MKLNEQIKQTAKKYAERNNFSRIANDAYKDLLFEPEKGVRYNNYAFVLFGLAIEGVTGMSYREYVL